MRAFVVYETMFGNTGPIARAVADGLSADREVTLTDVVDREWGTHLSHTSVP